MGVSWSTGETTSLPVFGDDMYVLPLAAVARLRNIAAGKVPPTTDFLEGLALEFARLNPRP